MHIGTYLSIFLTIIVTFELQIQTDASPLPLPQRRFRSTSTTTTTEPSDSGGRVASSTSSSGATEGPSRRLRRPSSRRSTTPIPQQGHPNNDLIRRGIIEKLCNRKYGATSTLATTKTKPSSSNSGGNTDEIAVNFESMLTNNNGSSPRRRTRVGSRATTPGPLCTDFDALSFEELVNRVKGGQRPVRRRN